MMHPQTELRWINDTIGYGVFAKIFIPRGTLVWTHCAWEQEFSMKEVQEKYGKEREYFFHYSYINARGNLQYNCDLDKYTNHSCDANSLYLNAENSVAIRDIDADKEITCDYGFLNMVAELKCLCGSLQCRQVIHHQDIAKQANDWKEKILSTLDFIAKVEQPLYPYVKNKVELDAIISQQLGLVDYHDFYCPPEILHALKKEIMSHE